MEIIQKPILKGLPDIPCGTGWKIYTHHRKIFKIGPDHPAFKIIIFMATTISDFQWRFLCQNCCSAIPFLLRWIPVMLIPQGFNQCQLKGKLIRAGFNFLQANHVRGFGLQPKQPILTERSPYSIDIITNNLQSSYGTLTYLGLNKSKKRTKISFFSFCPAKTRSTFMLSRRLRRYISIFWFSNGRSN